MLKKMIAVMFIVSSAYGEQPCCKKWPFKGELIGAAAIGAAAGALTGWAASSNGKHHHRSCCRQQPLCEPTLGTLTTHFSTTLINGSDIPVFFTVFFSNPLCTIVESPVFKVKPLDSLPISVELPFANPIEGTYHFGVQASTQDSQTIDITLVDFKQTVLFIEWKPQKGKSVQNDVNFLGIMPVEPFASQFQFDLPFTFGGTIGT